MKYPIEKYTFRHYKEKNEDGTESFVTVALTKYRGKVVKGVSKCFHDDTFDIEVGKKLAALRCNEKVCKRRYSNVVNDLKNTLIQANKIASYLDKVVATRELIAQEYNEARDELIEFTKSLQ